MDPWLLSNEESPLHNLMESTSVFSPYTYSVKASNPNTSRSRVSVTSDISSGFLANTVRFNLPRYGLLAGACLHLNVTMPATKAGATANSVTDWFGAYVIKNVQLNSHNKSLEEIPGAAIHYDAITKNQEKRQSLGAAMYETATSADLVAFQCTGTVDANAPARVVEVLVPLPFSSFRSTQSYLDLRFLEQLQIQCEFTANATDVMANQGFTISKCALSLEYVTMAESAYRAYQSENYSLDQPLSILGRSVYTEQPASVSYSKSDAIHATQNLSVELKCNNLATATFFKIRETTAAVAHKRANGVGSSAPTALKADTLKNEQISETSGATEPFWTRVQITASGKTIIDMTQREASLVQFGGGMSRYVNFASTSNRVKASDQWYTICWGSDADAVNANSGAISWKNLVAPTLTVTFGAWGGHSTVARTFALDVFHYYHSLVSISSSDGRITTGINV